MTDVAGARDAVEDPSEPDPAWIGPIEVAPEDLRRAAVLGRLSGVSAQNLLEIALGALVHRYCRQDVVLAEGLLVDRELVGRGLAQVARGRLRPPHGPPDVSVVIAVGSDDAAVLRVNLRPGLLTQAAGRVLVQQASRFIAAAIRSSDEPLAAISGVDEQGVRSLLTHSQGARRSYPPGLPVHALFEEHVRRRPGAVAVATAEAALSYSQLHGAAVGVAATLAERGIEPGDRVAILLERGIDAIVATLAISVAGAVAVPLDAAYPAARLRRMLDDPGIKAILSNRSLAPHVPAGSAPVWLIADLRQPPDDAALTRFTDARLSGNDVATVMYTSGSTGMPKGVEITHQGIIRLVTDGEFIDFGPEDTVLHLAPATFDAALLEVWGALARGARLELAPAEAHSVADLAELIEQRQVSVLWLTAGLFHQVAEFEPDSFAGVRRLLVGGDVVSWHRVRELLEAHPGLEIVNGYGPTENTTFTCCHLIRSASDLSEDAVPIGRPIANTQVYLLDCYEQLVPVGVAGELWAGGDGLARGYRGEPALTAQRFRTPAAAPLRGLRLYRTGDIAYVDDRGWHHFVGREDSQVKVNGYRVEPSEVEQVITGCPGVRQACVGVELDALGGKRLVGYVVAAAGAAGPVLTEVREHLSRQLPAFMIPARLVELDELPLTSNGKVDRDRLGRNPGDSHGHDG